MPKEGLIEVYKKIVLVIVVMVVLAVLLLVAQPALASGYNHPTDQAIPTEDNPHGGYTNTTNKCKTCHAVHLAEGNPDPTPGFVLLRANSASDECDYCHATGGVSQKIISGGTHGTHLGSSKGPAALGCSDCHKVHTTIAGAQFQDGELLTATTICDDCHSNGGAFDGVNDSDYGAKNNWAAGIYDGNNLKSGKEKWCASCHDADQASSNQDGTGVAAPDVSGDNSTYGYYISGHKLSCINCHNSSMDHLDDEARTYIAASDNYKDGYRLKLVGASPPLDIPRGDTTYSSDDFALCFSCHDETSLRGLPSGYKDWTGSQHASSVSVTDPGTNFRNEQSAGTFSMMMYGSTPYPANIHWDHLAPPEVLMQGNCTGGMGCHDVNDFRYDSDFDGSATDSKVSCPTCHDVHGTSYPRMTKNDLAITYGTDVAYINSTGYTTSGGDLYCANANCHSVSGSTNAEYYRAPTAGLSCTTCHLGTGDTDNFSSDGTKAVVDQTEWETKGHGRPTASGNYPVSGNPAANLGCDDCHDESVDHDTSSNFFRLKNTTHVTWGKNYTCQSCHATGESGATVKVDSTHYNITGGKHDTTNNGGQFCWDCHDPHGDSNIFMVQLKPAMKSDASTTIPTSLTTNNASFSQKTTGTDYAKSSAPFNGVCNVCHTTANHYTESSGDNHHETQVCVDCHPHTSSSNINAAFSHGGGGAGTGCVECHGHDSGSAYDTDVTYPNDGLDGTSQGAGTYTSHSTHTETDSDDAKGPGIYCDSCHDINNFPYFKSGTDGNGDSKYNLAETDVCDTCHSAAGTYDGVDDATIGAKNNWDNGVYTGSSLTSGKEKWCASCHDESPSVISSISAPNVSGDEDGSYTYGTGWGYYKTGHGLSSSEYYPASGGASLGSEIECDSCHDLSTSHIDGSARTYDDGDSVDTDPSVYRQGYRLKLVSSQEPMRVPWKQNITNSADQYRLCTQSGCHDSGPFVNSANMNTNLRTDGINRHEYHLNSNSYQFASDWSGADNSRMVCISCHNVHGSTRLAMVRDGKLTSREPGLKIWYYNDSVTVNQGNPDPPVPEDIPLSASTGTVWIGVSSANLCSHCHGSPNTLVEYRDPWWDSPIPVLDWTYETNYTEDGVHPDPLMVSGNDVEFRVNYTDKDNDAPTSIQVWIDENDNGTYETGEKYDMTEDDFGDVDYTDGKLYSRVKALTYAGDGSLNYRFYATDGTHTGIGEPTSDSVARVDLNGKRDVPGEYGTIQAAIDASTGEDVLVADGTYPENIDFTGKNITVESVNGAASTTIQGSGANSPVVTFSTSETSSAILDGFTIDNQATANSSTRGIYITNSSTPTIRDLVIEGNKVASNVDGGGIYINGGGATIESTTVGGDALNQNEARSGAGIYAISTSDNISITGSTITYNNASGLSAGIYLANVSSTTTISTTTISNNTSVQHGAGIYSNNSPLSITNCNIDNNTVTNTASFDGGGLYLNGASTTVLITGGTVNNNSTRNGGGLLIAGDADVTVTGTSINGNEAIVGGGGGINVGGTGTTLNISKSNIKGNEAHSNGGGIMLSNYAEVTVTNCTISGNTADGETYSDGGGIWNGATLNMHSSTISGNNAYRSGGGLRAGGSGATATNCIIWGNTSGTSDPQINGTATVTYSDVGGGYTGTGNIDSDPLFVDLQQASNGVPTTAGDFHIISASPVINQATSSGAPADDIDGDSRPQDGDYDMGSDEYVIPPGSPTLDWTGEANYTTDGVDPDSATTGSDFEFRIEYTDAENDAPTSIQVWVDENDDSSYAAGEKYDMNAVDGDSDYTDGKLYTKTLTLTNAGDGDLNYRFYASDGTNDAVGAPTGNKVVTVTPALEVPSGYATIQEAINAASGGDTIVVSDGTYSENINYNGKAITVQSVNGAASTTIQGDGSDAPVVTFSSGEPTSAILDGFTINNQTSDGNNRRGIAITSDSSPTIKNSIIRGNDPASYVDGNSIYISGGGVTIEDTTIGGTVGTPDTGDFGTGIYAINSSTKAISITGSTFAYNNGTNGGAIYLSGRTTATTITNTSFNNNSASQHGGAIRSNNSPLTLTDTTISSNSSTQDGAGLYLSGASTTLTISGTTSISSNSGRIGGGIYANGIGAVSISDATIDSNNATSYGAGMYLVNMAGNISISGTSVSDNTGTAGGAGIYFTSSAAISFGLTNCNIDNNTVTNTGSYDGGGFYLNSTSAAVTITGGTINGNSTRSGGGILATGGIDLTISGTTINSNTATSYGGGIYLTTAGSTLDISKSYIQGNSAPNGGAGIYIASGPTGTVTNCLIAGNNVQTDWRYGGGISNNGTLDMFNTTISGNYVYREGGGLYANGTETITNCIIYGNTADVGSNDSIQGSADNVTYSDIEGGYAGAGNINSNPLFVNFQQATSGNPTTAGDFHIQSGSPCKDQATSSGAPLDDIDSDSRPQGVGYDIGSDEYTSP